MPGFISTACRSDLWSWRRAGRRWAMRAVVAAMRGWATPIGITINTAVQNVFDSNGRIADADIQWAVDGQAAQLIHLAKRSAHGSAT